MIVRYMLTPQEFQQLAAPLLEEREAENCLILGNLTRLLDGPAGAHDVPGTDPFLCTVDDPEGRVVAAAMRTPPFNLLLSRAPAPAIAMIADHLARRRMSVPGFYAVTETAEMFLLAWQKLARPAHRRIRRIRRNRAYECTAPLPPPATPGAFAEATPADVDLLADWRRAFTDEIREPSTDHHAFVRALVDARRLFVWRNPAPVSMAATAGPTRTGIRVNLVYTPPPHRNRGYASALVGSLTQHLLSTGRRACFLFTDADNPTSNHIYATLGYRPVADYRLVDFEPAAP